MIRIQKIVNDTLKTPKGKWSRQSLTFFVSFIISILLGIIATFLSYFLNITVNETAMHIFDGFMTLTGVMSGTSIVSKLVEFKKAEKSE